MSSSGYAPDDHLVRAIKDFPVPTNKTDIRSFCGLAQQFEAFDPQLSALLSSLGSLLSSKSVFQWEAVHQEAFVKARQTLSSPRILTSYDRLRPLRLEIDAAQSRGLGMALWQQQEDGQLRLLQCASRHITETESRYSANEIELLAVTWAVQKVSIGRNAATRVHSNPGSSADQFDWEGRKIKGNRKKTPRKCPFQGRNLKVTTPEEGRGKEKVETCSVAVPSEVGFFGVQ